MLLDTLHVPIENSFHIIIVHVLMYKTEKPHVILKNGLALYSILSNTCILRNKEQLLVPSDFQNLSIQDTCLPNFS